jgi:hypothetical protein
MRLPPRRVLCHRPADIHCRLLGNVHQRNGETSSLSPEKPRFIELCYTQLFAGKCPLGYVSLKLRALAISLVRKRLLRSSST